MLEGLRRSSVLIPTSPPILMFLLSKSGHSVRQAKHRSEQDSSPQVTDNSTRFPKFLKPPPFLNQTTSYAVFFTADQWLQQPLQTFALLTVLPKEQVTSRNLPVRTSGGRQGHDRPMPRKANHLHQCYIWTMDKLPSMTHQPIRTIRKVSFLTDHCVHPLRYRGVVWQIQHISLALRVSTNRCGQRHITSEKWEGWISPLGVRKRLPTQWKLTTCFTESRHPLATPK